MVASPTMLVPHTEAASVVGVTPFLASTPVAQGGGGQCTTRALVIEPREPSRKNWPLDTVKVWLLPQTTKKTVYAVNHYKSVYICWNTL